MFLFVSHDAGGAEILSSFILRNKISQCKYILDGPAKSIFARKLDSLKLEESLEDALNGCELLVTGSSWQSDLEKKAIRLADSKGVKSVTYLDHWTNYRERFSVDGKVFLPDEIWVGDKMAYRIVKESLPQAEVILKENPYFLDMEEAIESINQKRKPNDDNKNILYVCEPVKEHAKIQFGDERYWGFTEEDALRFFLDNVHLFQPISEITVRPHPSESNEKYDQILKQFTKVKIRVSKNKDLIEEVAQSNIVVGCESMAMVVGLIAKKRVISVIPPGGRQCMLPHSEIDHLKLLI